MGRRKDRQGTQETDDRQARLKKALKANLARRKAAMRAEVEGDSTPSGRTAPYPSQGTEQEQDQNG